MTTFYSSAKTIHAGRKPVFGFLSDIRNFKNLIPEVRIRNFEAERDRCRFTVDGLGEIAIRVALRDPDENIRLESEGQVPFRFNILIRLDETGSGSTNMKITLDADLNIMMKMIAQKPIEEGVEMAATLLAGHLNNHKWA